MVARSVVLKPYKSVAGSKPILPPSLSHPKIGGQSLVHPSIPDISVAPTILNAIAGATMLQQAANNIDPITPSITDLLDIEKDLRLDPFAALSRHFRVYLLPGVVAGGVLTFAPQRRCVPLRLNVPNNTAASLITGLENGVDQYFATAAGVPAAVWSERNTDSPWLRPIITDVGKTITAVTTIPAGTPVGLWCADLSEDGLLSLPLGNPRGIGFGPVVVAAGGGAGTFTVNVQPQKAFRLRRLSLDSTVANWDANAAAATGVALSSLLVQNDPQTEANGPLPVSMFDMKTVAGDMDCDVCQVGGVITAVFTAGAATLASTLGGQFWGDSEE